MWKAVFMQQVELASLGSKAAGLNIRKKEKTKRKTKKIKKLVK